MMRRLRPHLPLAVTCGLLLLQSTVGHISDLCVSVSPDQCETATIWLMTYHHTTAGTSSGQAAVSVGTHPHAHSPFNFLSTCDGMALSRPSSVLDLELDMVARWKEFCPTEVHSQLGSGLDLVCFATVDTVTRVVTPREPSEPSGCGGCCSSRDIDEAGFITMSGVNARQDISVAVFGVDQVLQSSGFSSHACSLPSVSTAFASDQGAFANNPSMDDLRFTIPAGTISIPGCGTACPAYTPDASLNIASHDCSGDTVAPGALCNVQCPSGFVPAGTPVSCVGGPDGAPGRYDGQIRCTDQTVSDSSCVNGVCPDLTDVVGNTVTQITGTSCGTATPNSTECGFSCDRAQNQFSVGNVQAHNGGWVATNGASCQTCCGSTCDVTPAATQTDLFREDPSSNGAVAVCIEGCNFDPANDRVILVAGSNVDCGSVNATAAGGEYLDCDVASAACGTPSETLLACGGLSTSSLPSVGTVCICDSDVENGCSDIARKYSSTGPSFDTPVVVPQGPSTTDEPSTTPTTHSVCARAFNTFVLSEVSLGCDAAGSGDSNVDCYSTGKGSQASTAVDKVEFESAFLSWWGQSSVFANVSLNEVLLRASSTGIWDGPGDTLRQHVVLVDYRPGAPLTDADLTAALHTVQGDVIQLDYCGCETIVTVLGSSRGKREPTANVTATTIDECPDSYISEENRGGDGATTGKKGKKGGTSSSTSKSKKYKGKKGKTKKTKKGTKLMSALTVSASNSMVAGIVFGSVGVVSIALGVMIRRRRHQLERIEDEEDLVMDPDEYTALLPSY